MDDDVFLGVLFTYVAYFHADSDEVNHGRFCQYNARDMFDLLLAFL